MTSNEATAIPAHGGQSPPHPAEAWYYHAPEVPSKVTGRISHNTQPRYDAAADLSDNADDESSSSESDEEAGEAELEDEYHDARSASDQPSSRNDFWGSNAASAAPSALTTPRSSSSHSNRAAFNASISLRRSRDIYPTMPTPSTDIHPPTSSSMPTQTPGSKQGKDAQAMAAWQRSLRQATSPGSTGQRSTASASSRTPGSRQHSARKKLYDNYSLRSSRNGRLTGASPASSKAAGTPLQVGEPGCFHLACRCLHLMALPCSQRAGRRSQMHAEQWPVHMPRNACAGPCAPQGLKGF
jgi:hypothetical protein